MSKNNQTVVEYLMGRQYISIMSSILAIAIVAILVLFVGFYQYEKTKKPKVSLDSDGILQLTSQFVRSQKMIKGYKVPNDRSSLVPDPLMVVENYFPKAPTQEESLLIPLLSNVDCNSQALKKSTRESPQMNKMLTFLQWKCGQIPSLPKSLWQEPPYVHPQGGSWTFAVFKEGKKDIDWLLKNRNRLHFLEMVHLPKDKRTEFEAFASLFNPEGLKSLNEAYRFLILKDRILHSPYFSPDATLYQSYSKKDWEEYIKSQNIKASFSSSVDCQHLEKNICWSPLYKVSDQFDFNSLLWILIFTTPLLLLLVLLNIKEQGRMKKDFIEKQQLVMQTLAHELRHPVTGLKLSVEAIREDYDLLPDKTTLEFLRLTSISERMSRLVTNSQQYLKLLSDKGEFAFQYNEISSIEDFVESVLQDYQEKVVFCHGETDQLCRIDGYWVGTCLQNLVINALTHGQKPIEVHWFVRDRDLFLQVRDSGQASVNSLDALIDHKNNRGTHRGLGVGLKLVRNLVQMMNGELKFTNHPSTTFTIQLRGVLCENRSVG